jgi:hypothetical protein
MAGTHDLTALGKPRRATKLQVIVDWMYALG